MLDDSVAAPFPPPPLLEVGRMQLRWEMGVWVLGFVGIGDGWACE